MPSAYKSYHGNVVEPALEATVVRRRTTKLSNTHTTEMLGAQTSDARVRATSHALRVED